MLIGVPKEIKSQEYRIGLVPSSVRELVHNKHHVLVESGAGLGIGIDDKAYQNAGAKIVPDAETIFSESQMIVKVKEPQPNECKMLRKNQILFTYLHLAPDPTQTQLLVESKCTAIAYETVTDSGGGLPLLSPMSEVAGRMSIQAGAHCLEKAQGGRGILLGGIPGVAPAKVVILGGGVVGTNALCIAVGIGGLVTVIDKSLPRLRALDLQFGSKLNTVFATQHNIEEYVSDADLVIGAVLVPGAAAPKIVDRSLIKQMRSGSVIVDVSIDQGGCFATSKPTTHIDPTYIVDDVVHYCVTNMPGGAANTATFGLNNATLPFVLNLANKGLHQALLDDPHLMNGLNVHQGHVTYQAVAKELGYEYVSAAKALA